MRPITLRRYERSQHLACLQEGTSAEEYPSQADQRGGCEPRERSPDFCRMPIEPSLDLLQQSMRNEQNSLIAAPNQKQHSRVMPQSEHDHGKDQSQVSPPHFAAHCGERKEYVVANPERERHVPPRPEFRWVRGHERPLKVLRHCDPQRLRRAHRNMRVPGKIEEELQTV